MRRKDLWLLSFLVLNALGLWRGLWVYEQSLSRVLPDPVLVSAPEAEMWVAGREALVWRWDQPVVGDEGVGRPPEEVPAVFLPEVAGEFVWVNDRSLSFTPANPWVPGAEVQVALDVRVRNLQDQVSLTRHMARVLGPPLTLTGHRLMHVDGSREMQVSLQFNQEVSADAVRRGLEVLDGEGNRVRMNVRETPIPGEVFVTASLGAGDTLRFELKSGLTPASGGPGTMQENHVFSLQVPPRFQVLGMTPFMPTFGSGGITLRFTGAPDLKRVREQVRIDPPVRFQVGASQWWRRDEAVLTGEFIPGQRYTIELGAGVRGQHGRGLDAGVSRELVMPARSPGLRFPDGGEILNASGARLVRVETCGEGMLTMELRRVRDHNVVALLMRKAGADHQLSRQHPDLGLSVPVWESVLGVGEEEMATLDLSQALDDAGQGVYRLRVRGQNSRRTVERLLINGDLGLLTRRQGDEWLVWVVGLGDGVPVAGAQVQLWSRTRVKLAEGLTDESGQLRMKVQHDAEDDPMAVTAQIGGRLGLLSLEHARDFPGENRGRDYLQQGFEAHVHTDRGMYRPGETVHLHGIVRGAGFRLPETFPVELLLQGPDGLTRWTGVMPLGDLGTISAEVTLEAHWPNGRYAFELRLPGTDGPRLGRTTVNLESFVPPQIVVEADTREGTHHIPKDFQLRTTSRMLYGSAAADHGVEVRLTLTPEVFRSSEHPHHTFSDARKTSFSRFTRVVARGRTGPTGQADFPLEVPVGVESGSAMRAMIGVTVREFTGRPATTYVSRRVDVHPHYLGIHARAGSALTAELDLVKVDPEGREVDGADTVRVIVSRVAYSSGFQQDARGRFTYFRHRIPQEEMVLTPTLVAGRNVLTVPLPSEGLWEFAVEGEGAQSTSTEIPVGNVAGRPERADRVKLALERTAYRPGAVANLRVHAPFAGKALITVEGDQIWHSRVEVLPEDDHVVPIVVPDAGVGNLWVRVSMLRPLPGGGGDPHVFAEGALPLPLDMEGWRLSTSVGVAPMLEPGEDVEVVVQGAPGAEVVLAGVDEGILLLNDFRTPDPFGYFSEARRYPGRQWDVFDLLMPEQGDRYAAGDPEMGGGADMLRNRLNPVDAKRFRPLALWSGPHRIPESGTLRVTIPLPEFTGQIRWMAVQAGREGVGSAAAVSHVARSVVTQQGLPLFLAPGDETDWLVRVHNREDTVAEIRVALSVSGPVEITETDAEVLRLGAGEVRVLRHRVRARNDAGVATFGVDLSAGGVSWRDEIEMAVRPVHAYHVRERHVVLEAGEGLSLTPETSVHAHMAQRSVRVSGIPTLDLSAAAGYLLRYPFGCLEQTVSAGMPALWVPDLVGAHAARAAEDIVNDSIARIWLMQTQSGGFGYWPGTSSPSFEASRYALAFLLAAEAQGFVVDAARKQLALEWVREALNRSHWNAERPADNLGLADGARVLALAGQLDRGWVQRLRERRTDLDALGRIYAAEALTAAGERPLATEMLQGMGVLDVKARGWYSATSVNAEFLRVLLRLNPADGRVPELVAALFSARNAEGTWSHTYENATALRALAAHARAFGGGEVTPDVRWADGRSLMPDKEMDLALALEGRIFNHGTAPVFVRELVGGLPVDGGSVENAFDFTYRLLSPEGTPLEGALTSGDHVLLHVKLQNLPPQLSYLAVDIRLPAGLEPLSLGMQRRVDAFASGVRRTDVFQHAHLEVRDDRILLFPPQLDGGKAEWWFLVRAVTPGSFTFPAPQAQAMYRPDVVAQGVARRLEVVP